MVTPRPSVVSRHIVRGEVLNDHEDRARNPGMHVEPMCLGFRVWGLGFRV